MRFIKFLPIGIGIFILSGCATHFDEDHVSDPYGFLFGFWHGLIFVFALIANFISWFLGLFGFDIFSSIQIIGRPNTGFWYYVGFVFGLLVAGGSSKN